MTERLNMLLDEEEIKRLDELRSRIYTDDPTQRARGLLTRSDAARLALVEGLAALEARYGIADDPEHYPEFAEEGEYA